MKKSALKQLIKEVLEEEVPIGNVGLENNIRNLRNKIVGMVDKMTYNQLIHLLDYLNNDFES